MLVTAYADSTAFHPLLDEKKIQYERIENIKPKDRQLLIDDLRERTGLDIRYVEVGKIDFLKDCANLKVFYVKNDHGTEMIPRWARDQLSGNMNKLP